MVTEMHRYYDYSNDPAGDWNTEWAPRRARARNGTGFWIGLFLFLSLLVCVSMAVLIPGGLGFIVGYNDLQVQNHEAAIQHFERGLGYLAENYPELAYTEFEISAKYDPEYEPAQIKLREMQAAFGGNGTPGPEEENRVAATLFDEARDLIAQREWSYAIDRLEQLRNLNTQYRVQEAMDLLYGAYVEGGKEAVTAGQIELARERFESALAIHGGDTEVQRQRDLAMLYLDGQQAAGYNWQLAIQKFSTLYQQAPQYNDVKRRLVEAYVQYGDLASQQNAWCLAVREYEGALAIMNDAQLASKRAQAMSNCRQAIVPTPTVLGGTPFPGLTPIPGTTPTNEFYTARATYVVGRPCTSGVGDLSGVVQDALGQPLAGVPVAYYADGINRVTKRTDAKGTYQFVWGLDPGVFHVVVLGASGNPASIPADIRYPGGNSPNCHVVVDWRKVQ